MQCKQEELTSTFGTKGKRNPSRIREGIRNQQHVLRYLDSGIERTITDLWTEAAFSRPEGRYTGHSYR
jgi:hypothetical protein